MLKFSAFDHIMTWEVNTFLDDANFGQGKFYVLISFEANTPVTFSAMASRFMIFGSDFSIPFSFKKKTFARWPSVILSGSQDCLFCDLRTLFGMSDCTEKVENS